MIMNKFLTVIALLFISVAVSAQSVEVTKEANGTKILKGFVNKTDIATDTSFAWYAQNRQGYTPDAGALQAFKNNKDSIHILAFGGTWCGDTKSLLPKFYALTEAAGFPEERITLLGVDRSKKTVHGLEKAFNVTRVPTFIVLKDGKEIGRVVEYGKYGMVDKELGEIINSAKK